MLIEGLKVLGDTIELLLHIQEYCFTFNTSAAYLTQFLLVNKKVKSSLLSKKLILYISQSSSKNDTISS